VKKYIVILIAFAAGVGTNYWFSGKAAVVSDSGEQAPLYWVAPMDPSFRSDKPGKSPMGMDLIPVYEEGTSNDGSITISPRVEQNLGVRTATVKKQDISRIIDTVGSITVDENKIEHIHVYTEGWVRQLLAKTEGEYVKKGQLLFRVYSPTLLNAQKEYLLALQNKNTLLQQAGLKKLQALGFSSGQTKKLRATRKVFELVDVYASQAGVISDLKISEGMFIKPNQTIMVIEDFSQIWLMAEIYERQANWVAKGQKAEMSLPYLPGKKWFGEVDYVYPELDKKSLTLRVRLKFNNSNNELKINMFGDVKIYTTPQENALVIPREAVIYTGQETRVVMQLADGQYATRQIKIGIEADDLVEVTDGLQAGEVVVSSAQFLLDSESSLAASFNRIDEAKDS
jgi:membrane fusion protein, copper/silver efflux system